MSVRAKFRVWAVEDAKGSKYNNETKQYEERKLKTIKMNPVFHNNDPNHENSKFWNSSPGGILELACANPNAVDYFVPGKEYYLDFTLAEEGEKK